jgi:c-di-GMP-binding flagellar brake protein YcgR
MSERRNRKRHSDNRRDKKRIYAELDVKAYINDEEYLTKMRNISGNGMQIVEPSDVEVQTQQDCKVLIQQDNTSIKIEALVVWKDFGLVGLCFKKQTPKIQKQLNKLSEKLELIAVTDIDMANLV